MVYFTRKHMEHRFYNVTTMIYPWQGNPHTTLETVRPRGRRRSPATWDQAQDIGFDTGRAAILTPSSLLEFKTKMIAVLHDSIDSFNNASLRPTRRSHSTCYARVTQYVIAIHKIEYTFYTTNILTFLTCIFPKHKPERRSIGLQSHSQQHNLPKPLLTICHENNYF